MFWWNSWALVRAHSSSGPKKQRLLPALSPASDRDGVPSLSLLQAEQPRLLQPFLLGEMLQLLDQLYISLLGATGIALGAVGMA